MERELLDPGLESLRKALIRHYKSEIEKGTVTKERRDALKKWLLSQGTDYTVDELWDVTSTRFFVPVPRPIFQEASSDLPPPSIDSAPSHHKPHSRGREGALGSSPPRRPPSPESGSPRFIDWSTPSSSKAKAEDTYVHSYFDQIHGAVSFNRAARPPFFQQKEATPGPAYYNASDTRLRSQSPRTVISKGGKRLEKWGDSDTPGPGYYSPRLHIVPR